MASLAGPARGGHTGRRLELIALGHFPMIEPGDDLAKQILAALDWNDIALRDGDALVLAQKIVSKSEGRYARLADVSASARAVELAKVCQKDPRLVELALSESTEVLRCKPGVIILRHRLGLVLANAGIDHSNIDAEDGAQVLLLPVDPDASAARIRRSIEQAVGVRIGLAIIDSLGRAWRVGTSGICIGASGLTTVADLRGRPDLYGQRLATSVLGAADELAAAASLVMGQGDEGAPLVLARGLDHLLGDGDARDLVRALQEDLFK